MALSWEALSSTKIPQNQFGGLEGVEVTSHICGEPFSIFSRTFPASPLPCFFAAPWHSGSEGTPKISPIYNSSPNRITDPLPLHPKKPNPAAERQKTAWGPFSTYPCFQHQYPQFQRSSACAQPVLAQPSSSAGLRPHIPPG